jgi:hypothetical protein
MRNLAKQLKLNRAMSSLVGSLMLVGLLGACNTVTVTVDTCPPGSVRNISSINTPPDEPGACNSTPLLTSPTDAYNALNTANNNLPITDHNHTCNVGTRKCKSSPGTCLVGGVYKPCKTYFTPDVPPNGLTGNCNCGCPPA